MQWVSVAHTWENPVPVAKCCGVVSCRVVSSYHFITYWFSHCPQLFDFFLALIRVMSCAGATDLYNSVDALVQPVRDDALRPLSGQYLMRLSAGRRSPVLSLLRLARNVLHSSVRTSNSVLCLVSSCGMSHMRPVSASEPRHQEEANFYADRSCLKKPSSSQRTMRVRAAPRRLPQELLHCALLSVAFSGYTGRSVVESCISKILPQVPHIRPIAAHMWLASAIASWFPCVSGAVSGASSCTSGKVICNDSPSASPGRKVWSRSVFGCFPLRADWSAVQTLKTCE